MIKLWFLFLVALSQAAFSQVPAFNDVDRTNGQRVIADAGKVLADNLRSANGARFRGVYLFKTIGTDGRAHINVCGEVNAQNGYGGMSGFVMFTTAGKTLLTGSSGILNANMVCNGTTARVRDDHDYTTDLRKAFDANAGQ